jgi:hypothetical protein
VVRHKDFRGMSQNQGESRSLVARLLRRQRALNSAPLQFSLQSLLLATGYFCAMIWLVLYLIRNAPLGIPIYMHLGFVLLWVSVIGGAAVSNNAWAYFLGGLIGLGAALPVLLAIYVHDLESIPVLTAWATSYAFAMSANVGGAIACVRNDQLWIAAFAVSASTLASVVLLAFLYA